VEDIMSNTKNLISHFIRSITGKALQDTADAQIRKYIDGGRIPWSDGYKPYRLTILKHAITSPEILDIFRCKEKLPPEWGYGIDERIVEYPWLLSRLDKRKGVLLDAGSTLNFSYLLDHSVLSDKTILIMTLAPEHFEKRANVSYLFGDLRDMLIRDQSCDWIVCISTLEHIGMDNTQIYTKDNRFRESNSQSYTLALREMMRVLKPKGHLYITVPFGKYQDLGWLQQFDIAGIRHVKDSIEMTCIEEIYFHYTIEGWKLSGPDSCREAEYFDVHSAPGPASDRASAARAVACLEFVK
jgi:hypothetical protein